MAKRREDSFFGMHFDFHAGKNQTGIGSNCAPEVIGKLLDAVKPDYVQCDTKGHAGATSYPTKVGNPAAGMVGDILRMWREETEKRGVGLYAHHSGVWDNLAVEKHPDWAAWDEEGKPSAEKTSVFGPYCDELLAPQLIEMATEYGLDGAWVDGECWAVMPDYSPWAKAAYAEKYGKEPPKRDEEGYDEFLEFNRQGFRDYVTRYIRAVKSKAPNFQVASNWLYTSFAPEKMTVPVDFISGDYSPADSVNTARIESYILANQPQPWDLMAWGFNIQNDYQCVKELEQLCQEAAVVISVGGGFQVYNRQLVGTVQEWAIPMWAKLAEFCRARQALCHHARPVPQVGIIYSEKAFYNNKKKMFTPYGCRLTEDIKGSLFAVLDNQYSAEILMTHHTDRDFSPYGLIFVPDGTAIEDDLKAKLLAYAENGGVLVISGENSVGLFAEELGIKVNDTFDSVVRFMVDGQGATARTTFASIKAESAMITKWAMPYGDDETATPIPAAVEKAYGKGKLIGLPFALGRTYLGAKSATLRRLTGEILSAYADPTVRVFGSSLVEVALTEKDGKQMVNLLNLAGVHADDKIRAFNEIPPLTDLTLVWKTDKCPTKVTLEPEGEPLKFYYADGKAHITVPKLKIHAVITME
ncbi:MAG: hypothetical protein E7452_05415 [Ruminococcaceae bacterium]|nr:hypothetical protein [Oscillospiraceae bacterium]